jgi:cobalt-zinc-cadmium efflux system membrane fusion protein
VAQATYQGLMDQMGYQAKLANTRARQAKHQAETAVRTAQERLRIFGVKPDGTEPEVEGGKVVGVKSDGTLPAPKSAGETPVETPDAIIPQSNHSRETPVSTYSIWAPFDGTILDREMIVPGVAVDTTHRIFTMANLATVWIEASVPEGDFNLLARSGTGGKVRFRSPAYLDRVFEGEVIYSGDLVDEKSRTVKLLAKAENPDRLLKPGMFVEVEVMSPRTEAAVQIPASALLAEGGRSFVFVKNGADRFVRREVDAELPRGGIATIRRGLTEGDEVVVGGEFKLKALSVRLASAGR